MRIIAQGPMSMTLCPECDRVTPHLGDVCLVCNEVKKQQEANRLDAMELYDGAAIEVSEDEGKIKSYIEILNKALQRKYPDWRIEYDAVCGFILKGELACHALSESSLLKSSPGRVLERCERLIKHGVDGDEG